jgi:hypothetical protein
MLFYNSNFYKRILLPALITMTNPPFDKKCIDDLATLNQIADKLNSMPIQIQPTGSELSLPIVLEIQVRAIKPRDAERRISYALLTGTCIVQKYSEKNYFFTFPVDNSIQQNAEVYADKWIASGDGVMSVYNGDSKQVSVSSEVKFHVFGMAGRDFKL